MDLTNLRQHHEELVNHMKNSGYSMSCIYMYKRQIREILDLDLESWTSYQDIYQYFVSISSNQKDLKWRRSVIGSIEYFDIYGLFPDRRRICSFIEPRGAYHSLNHVYQQLMGHVTLESTKYYYSIVPNLSSIMMNQTNETFDWIVPEVNTDEEIY